MFQEFWFSALTTFLYLTAFSAQLATYPTDNPAEYDLHSTWYDAQVAAGVRQSLLIVSLCFPPLEQMSTCVFPNYQRFSNIFKL